jgi:hypothetical protein
MAAKIAKVRTWVSDTLPESTIRQRLQNWIDQNSTAESEEQIAEGIKQILTTLTDSERSEVSAHLTGRAFDIQHPTNNTERIKSDIRALPGVERFLEDEEGASKWHIQFEVK